jgi:hypothetical protein
MAVFLHVVGALGLFAGIGLEQVSLFNLRRASTTTQARDWLAVLGGLRRVDAPSGITILATGFAMLFARWGHQAWIGLAILGMVAMAILSVFITGRRASALRATIPDGDNPVSTVLRARLLDRAMHASASFRAAIALGIVFNMTVKPATPGAVAAIAVALLVGGIAAVAGMPSRSDSALRPTFP